MQEHPNSDLLLTLLIPSSVIYFQTSLEGTNAAFRCAIGSGLLLLATSACNSSYFRAHVNDK